MTFREITRDHGAPLRAYASNNMAEYILTSAYAKDEYKAYLRRYNRQPSAKWLNRHNQFERV